MADSLCDLSGGEIRSSPLAAVLVEALRLRATGELRVDANGGTSRVYFRGGQPCGAQVFFGGFKPLGQFLLEQGWIDIEALERSLAAVVDGRKQGEALVELGYLTREKLQAGLRAHHQRHLRNLASVSEGTYTFRPLDELPAWTDEIRLSGHRAIVDALAAPPGQALATKILRRVPSHLGLRLRSGWQRFTGHFELDGDEARLLGALEAPIEVEKALALDILPEARAAAVMAALHLMGILVPTPLGGQGPWRTPGPAIPSTPGPIELGSAGPARAVPERIVPGPTWPAAPPSPGGGRALELDLGLGEAVDWAAAPQAGIEAAATLAAGELLLDPMEDAVVLEVEPAEPDATVVSRPGNGVAAPAGLDPAELEAMEREQRRAAEEARRLHAEREEEARRAREEALRNPLPSFRSDAAGARERRARMLQRAFGNIPGGDALLRARDATPGPASAPEPAGPVGWESLPPPGDPAFDRAVRERLERIAGEDHFTRLGVPRTATRDAIKQAFFAAAKRFHPDRIPSAAAHLAPQLREIFAAINESYQLLQDDEKRERYRDELAKKAAAAARAGASEPVRAFEQEVAAAFKRRDFAAAQQILAEALEVEDRPDLRAHLLWARQLERPHETFQVRGELERLAERHPRCAAARYYLGVLARVAGDTESAERHFHAALEVMPDHREARQELRLIELRKAANPRMYKR